MKNRINFMNIYIDNLTMDETIDHIDELVKQNEMLKDQNNYLKNSRK